MDLIMTNGKIDPKWLRRGSDEWQWAERYISKRADSAMRDDIRRFARRVEGGYDQVVADVSYLEQSAEGALFVTRLKNALRQHRSRSSSNGKKQRIFSLPRATRAILFRQAKENKITETQVITALIDDAEWAIKQKNEREKTLRTKMELERKRSALALAAAQSQLKETMKHLERATELLVSWELAMQTQQPPFEGEQETIRKETEQRLWKVKTLNSMIALSHGISNEE